jgi:hypothetical protein
MRLFSVPRSQAVASEQGLPVGLKPNYEPFWAKAQLRTFLG